MTKKDMISSFKQHKKKIFYVFFILFASVASYALLSIFNHKKTLIVIAYSPFVQDNSPFIPNTNQYDVYYVVHSGYDWLNPTTASERASLEQLKKSKGWITTYKIENYQSCYEAIKELQRQHNLKKIDYLVGLPGEEWIYTCALLRDSFGISHGLKSKEASFFVHKDKMKEKLQELNIPTIPFVKDISQAWGVWDERLVLKPVDKDGSRDIYIINTKEEYDDAIAEIEKRKATKSYIAEPYIDGIIYNVDGIIQHGQIKYLICSEKHIGNCYNFYREHKPLGTRIIKDIEKTKILSELAKDFLAMGHRDGGFHIEIIQDKKTKGYMIMEGAARITGSLVPLLIKKHHGVDLFQERIKAELLQELSITKEMEVFPTIVGGVVLRTEKEGEIESLMKKYRVQTGIEYRKHWIKVKIINISPTSFKDEYTSFDGYYVDRKETEKLPLMGDTTWYNTDLTYDFCITILQNAETEETFLKDSEEIAHNFVLKVAQKETN